MRCKNGHEMPFDPDLGLRYNCIFCEAIQRPTSDDYLTRTELKLVTESRPAQIQLSKIIDQAYVDDQVVMVEAGTGVGKSFAYLLPAILSGKRTVVSTAKKSLQSQLIKKDLPYLQQILAAGGFRFTFAPAYGKNNYACLSEVKKQTNALEFDRKWSWFFEHAPTGRWVEEKEAYAKYVGKGGKHSVKLPMATSKFSAEDCKGPTCNHASECKFLEARKKVDNANVVVANHWLVGFHLRLQREMNAFQLLGEMPYLIVDEAHKFEDGIRAAFTHEIRENALKSIISGYEEIFEQLPGPEQARLGGSLDFPRKATLKKAWDGMFKRVKPHGDAPLSAQMFGKEGGFLHAQIEKVMKQFDDPQFIRDLTGCSHANAFALIAALEKTDDKKYSGIQMDEFAFGLWFNLQTTKRRLKSINDALTAVYEESDNRVSFLEHTGHYAAIRIAPIDIAPFMIPAHNNIKSTIYVSATLAVNNSMKVFSRRTGVSRHEPTQVVQAQFGSSFDLDKQALMYLSKKVPIATRKEGEVDVYRKALAEEIYALTHAIQGNAFVLFTARDEMRSVYEELSGRSKHPLLVQDKISAAELLDQYRRTDNAILLGVKSFWEGIDVPGDKLSLVIITKLPFPGRSDPIVTARRARARDEWFRRVDLPDMILDLRQGVGRLIRSKQDRGVIAILDQRLLTKRYKSQVINSLGIKQVTTSDVRVQRALKALAMGRSKNRRKEVGHAQNDSGDHASSRSA